MSDVAPTIDRATLTTEMRRAIQWAKKHGGEIHRHPGGFWGSLQWTEMDAKWIGTSTVESLVKRGIAEYRQWHEGRNGRFPILAALIEKV